MDGYLIFDTLPSHTRTIKKIKYVINEKQAACSSYQNTIGRHSTIGPYSHLSTKYPYHVSNSNTNSNNDFSHTSQYGYNSWGMWRDSRNLTPSSTYSSKSRRTSIKSFTIILMTAAFIVVLAVLSVAALAFYFSTFKSDDSIMIFDGKFQVSRGDVFTTGLKYNHTTAYQQKAEFYKNLITESLEHNGLTVYKCTINGFGAGPLIHVDFRVYLDMRRVPITIRSVEEHIKDSVLKEVMSSKSSRSIQIDLSTVEIKRQLDSEVLKTASFVRESVATTPSPSSSMQFDDKARKPSTQIINRPNPKLTTAKPKPKPDIVEPELDLENVPMIQGSFEVTKTDADLTQKKVKTSTLRPFTITNGGVRMKTKKTTIEKVKPLPKVPENLTANILKLENVTKPYHIERVTTSRPLTTQPLSTTTVESTTRLATQSKSSTTAFTPTIETTSSIATVNTKMIDKVDSPTVSPSAPPQPPPPSTSTPQIDRIDLNVDSEESRPMQMNPMKVFPSAPVIDDQPWMPIQPSIEQLNYTANDAKKKIPDPVSLNNQEVLGFQLLPRNKIRQPIAAAAPPPHIKRTKLPTLYQSYANPALSMYRTHEVERLGNNGMVQPYPIPVDLISEQTNRKKHIDDLVLNKGEIFTTDFRFKGSDALAISTTAASSSTQTESTTTTESIEESVEESVEESAEDAAAEVVSIEHTNETEKIVDESPPSDSPEVGDILLDLLQETANPNESIANGPQPVVPESKEPESPTSDEAPMLSRMDEIELPDDHTEALEALATAISTMETLSFKNIKDYIMATTKSLSRETATEPSSTEAREHSTTPRKEMPQNIEEAMKFDRISQPSTIGSTTPKTIPTTSSSTVFSSTTSSPIYDSEEDRRTASYVEIETVQYTPGAMSWDQPALFPVQSKWEYVGDAVVYPTKAPMRKVFNETLQAWIVENPSESHHDHPIRPSDIMRNNNNEPIKNISAIFDTLASKIGVATDSRPTRLPPSMSHFVPSLRFPAVEIKTDRPDSVENLLPIKLTTTTTPAPVPPTQSVAREDELPVLLSEPTENFYSSSAETILGQAEVEEVDPTQYEQMLLIDRVSSALRATSTAPSLITLMPVKSNSGIRSGAVINEKISASSRGFPPTSAAAAFNKRIEDTSFVVRTNINVSSQ